MEDKRRHGGPYDRGAADAYYQRDFDPHYFKGDTYNSERVGIKDMTWPEIEAYSEGFAEQKVSGEVKDWGSMDESVESTEEEGR